jgi:hypothetical protein
VPPKKTRLLLAERAARQGSNQGVEEATKSAKDDKRKLLSGARTPPLVVPGAGIEMSARRCD